MKRLIWMKITALIVTITLTGCSAASIPTPSAESNSPPSQETITKPTPTETTSENTVSPEDTEFLQEQSTRSQPNLETNEYGLTEQQKNSFSMLYYLAITAEEIRTSKDNRLLLDDIYSSLLNDINPGAIDETTQEHLQNLRDIIKSYINISVKRKRLQYIYNQEKAAVLHSAVPNPLAVLSVTNSLNWKKLVTAAVYTAIDSFSNYKSATDAAEQEFLMSGWELDDEETEAIYKNRERAFDYMVNIVRKYGLDGRLTLNEKSIETFAKICAIDSVQQKIRRLQSEEETYKLLGNYWLELADCYYETSQYEKCLECVEKYEDLSTGIYRKDANYVQILPKAIVAAQGIYSADEYISTVKAFADDIISNTSTEEWSIRYFAAQVYMDLFARTDDRTYLDAAYDIAYDNVTILLDEQLSLNTIYLSEVKETTIEEPNYRFMTDNEKKNAELEYKDEQKRLTAYNKGLKEARKTELPPLYEPLVLNCDLLFALADKINIGQSEKSEIEAVLQSKTNGVFLTKPINDRYSFSPTSNSSHIEFRKDEALIPVDLLVDGAKITIKAIDNGKVTLFDDCCVTKVERDGDEIASFTAHITSKQMKDYKWTENSKVTVEISYGDNFDRISFNFKIKEYKDYWWFIPDKVVFEEE